MIHSNELRIGNYLEYYIPTDDLGYEPELKNRDTGGHIQITTFLGYNKNMIAEHYNWFLENHYDLYGVL